MRAAEDALSAVFTDHVDRDGHVVLSAAINIVTARRAGAG